MPTYKRQSGCIWIQIHYHYNQLPMAGNEIIQTESCQLLYFTSAAQVIVI